MGLPQLLHEPSSCKGRPAEYPNFVGRGNGLASTGDTAAGAAHDLDEGIIALPSRICPSLCGVSQTVRDCDLDVSQRADFYGGSLTPSSPRTGVIFRSGRFSPVTRHKRCEAPLP